jgi:hypothetical protein
MPVGQESCKSQQKIHRDCHWHVHTGSRSLIRVGCCRNSDPPTGCPGQCKGVGSPNGWYTVPQQPGICMNRPALETIPPWVRNPANHGKGVLSRSQASLLGPDGPCKGVGSPNGWYTLPQQPGICMNRPALQVSCKSRQRCSVTVTRSHLESSHPG